MYTSITLSALLVVGAAAQAIPSNLEAFYNNLTAQNASCRNVLKSGFYSTGNTDPDAAYCGDHLHDYQIIYIQGSKGSLTNMDIDCDGTRSGSDDRCGSSSDTQGDTAFEDTVAGYNAGIKNLNPDVHPYVVFGNDNDKPGFKPETYGVQPLSVMAVVCNHKLVYGIWGDTNAQALVGEASISLATACFGDSVNGNNGYDKRDVLYIAFAGDDAVPGAKGAKWSAKSYDDFENSISSLGKKLVKRIGS